MNMYLKSLRKNQDVLYQSKNRYNNKPIGVFIISISESNKTAVVETMGDNKIQFRCLTSSLFM